MATRTKKKEADPVKASKEVSILIYHTGIAAEGRKEKQPDGSFKMRYFIFPQINGEKPFEVECNVPQEVPEEIATILKPMIAAQRRHMKA